MGSIKTTKTHLSFQNHAFLLGSILKLITWHVRSREKTVNESANWLKNSKCTFALVWMKKKVKNLFDSAILIDDQGKILIKHRTINVLPELMTPPCSAGKGVQAVSTRFEKIGVMICADSF